METTKSIPEPVLATAPAAPAIAADTPPWLEDDGKPVAAPRRQHRKASPIGQARVEAVHWGVTLLTLFTAASVLFGARGAEITHSRELLPVMIITSAR